MRDLGHPYGHGDLRMSIVQSVLAPIGGLTAPRGVAGP